MAITIKRKVGEIVLPQKGKKDLTPGEHMISHDTRGRFAKGNKYGGRPGVHPYRNRPIRQTISASYRGMLGQPCPYDPAQRTWGELIAEAICLRAMAGDVAAAKELREATEGNKFRLKADWRDAISKAGGDPDKVLFDLISQVRNNAGEMPTNA